MSCGKRCSPEIESYVSSPVTSRTGISLVADHEGYRIDGYFAIGRVVDDRRADSGFLFTGPELHSGWRALKLPVGVDDLVFGMSNGCVDIEAVLSEMLERGYMPREFAEYVRWYAIAEAMSLGIVIETAIDDDVLHISSDVINMSAGTGFCESHRTDNDEEDDGLYVDTEWEELRRRIGIGKPKVPTPVYPALDSFSAALARGTLVGKKAKKFITAKKNAKKKKKVK